MVVFYFVIGWPGNWLYVPAMVLACTTSVWVVVRGFQHSFTFQNSLKRKQDMEEKMVL